MLTGFRAKAKEKKINLVAIARTYNQKTCQNSGQVITTPIVVVDQTDTK